MPPKARKAAAPPPTAPKALAQPRVFGIAAAEGYLRLRFDLGADYDFQKRVAQALAEVAVTVYGETPPPANHQKRADYALQVVGDPPLQLVFNGAPIEAHPRSFSVARILATQGYDKNSTDAQLVAGVGNIWNALAGA